MSLSDGELHAVAGVGLGVVTGGLVLAMIVAGWLDTDRPPEPPEPIEQMEAIQASLAYRKAPAKQPQKQTRQPEPTRKAEGVSRDENKPPDDKKPPEPDKRKTSTDPKDFKIPNRIQDDDLPVNDKPSTDVGEFNDNERGFASVNTGDPWFGRLASQFRVEFPSTEEASTAAGCVHILADGTIKKTKIDPRSDNGALNAAIETALRSLQQERNDKPELVPTHLLKQATTRWICFKIDAQKKVGP
jgi:hypothetical protein